jgi:hypothetical protein
VEITTKKAHLAAEAVIKATWVLVLLHKKKNQIMASKPAEELLKDSHKKADQSANRNQSQERE